MDGCTETGNRRQFRRWQQGGESAVEKDVKCEHKRVV